MFIIIVVVMIIIVFVVVVIVVMIIVVIIVVVVIVVMTTTQVFREDRDDRCIRFRLWFRTGVLTAVAVSVTVPGVALRTTGERAECDETCSGLDERSSGSLHTLIQGKHRQKCYYVSQYF